MGGVCTAVLLFPPDRGEWGDFVASSLSRQHFLCIGCTLYIWQLKHTFCTLHISCQIFSNKHFKEIFKTCREFGLAALMCGFICPAVWFTKLIWLIWLVSWLVIWSLEERFWLLEEGFWFLAAWWGAAAGEVGTQSEQRPPGG